MVITRNSRPERFMWMADGVEFQYWHAVSPVSGKIDAFEWRKPVNKLSAPEIEDKQSRTNTSDSMRIIQILRRN